MNLLGRFRRDRQIPMIKHRNGVQVLTGLDWVIILMKMTHWRERIAEVEIDDVGNNDLATQ